MALAAKRTREFRCPPQEQVLYDASLTCCCPSICLSVCLFHATSSKAVRFTCFTSMVTINRKSCTESRPHQSAWSCMYVSFGQRSSLLWTHTLRPFYSTPIALTQEGRSLVNDVCECVRDWRVREGWVGVSNLSGIYSAPLLGVAYCLA